MRESVYQNKLIKKLKDLFPGCFILKNDPTYIQGIPDLTIFFGGRWAMLEVKESIDAPIQPNQEYYIEQFGKMSYAAFIYPENERVILDELQYTLRSQW